MTAILLAVLTIALWCPDPALAQESVIDVGGSTYCRGKPVTIRGTNKADRLIGTPGNDVIAGFEGNDFIDGRGGNDTICAGSGNDTIVTRSGRDFVDGGKGNDRINAGDGNNKVIDKYGNNHITAGGGADAIYTGPGNDTIVSGDGDDIIRADGGNDNINSGGGNDNIRTDGGKDVIAAGDGDDVIDSGRGKDNVDAGSGHDVCRNAEVTLQCEDDGTSDGRPIADAGTDFNTLVGVRTQLDGSGSSDPDGDLITYLWTNLEKPDGSSASLDDPTSPSPSFVPDQAGPYTWQLIVSDGTHESLPDQVSITATPVSPPNANAGGDITAAVGNAVQLDGSASSDPQGLSLTFAWTFVQVPTGSARTDADIVDADKAQASFTPDVEGTFVLQLSIDNGFLKGEDTVEVEVTPSNVAPTADAGEDVYGPSGQPLTLDGSGSSDPDAGPQPLTYVWRFVSVPTGSARTDGDITNADKAQASFTPDIEGSYVLELKVNDGVLEATDNVMAVADDTPPTITFSSPADGSTQTTPRPAFAIDYTDAGSGLNLTTFKLAINSTDVTASSAIGPAQATYALGADLPAGANQAAAEITDRAGNRGVATSNFTITGGGPIFTAEADCSPLSGVVPLNVRFRSRGTFTGGSIVRYRWDFNGDGIFDTADAVAQDYTYTYTAPGSYTATLEVLNNLSQTATDSCAISAQGNAPTAAADVSPSNGPVPLDVTLSCTGSDPDGQIVLYEWDFEGDGTFDFSSATTGVTTHTYATAGQFTAVCRVTDNSGLTATARTTTTVIRPGPPGSPQVTASANPVSGDAPLQVSFDGVATDDGTITKYEWDFEGDGTFDSSSATTAQTSFTYQSAGIYAATLRVTDDAGLSSQDTVEILVGITANIEIADDTFEPGSGETATVRTTLSADVTAKVFLKNKAGTVVRTLFEGARTAGTYDDAWDGKNDAGQLLPEDAYYAVLQVTTNAQTITIDLTDTTGGDQYNPSRDRFPGTFAPFNDDLLRINFTIPESRGASEVTAFIGLFNQDTRFITLLDRVPLGVGEHTLFWDGLDANGKFAVPPAGDAFLFGLFALTLPDNAIFLKSRPGISNVSVDPNYFDPATPVFITPGHPTATVSFDLDKAATVELVVTNIETGVNLKTVEQPTMSPGSGKTITWDGKADSGLFADSGDYRLSVRAVDAAGSPSLTSHALVRVFY